MDLTLRRNHNQRDLHYIAMGVQLAVVPINLLETVLVLQAEHQDDSIHPAAELQVQVGNR